MIHFIQKLALHLLYKGKSKCCCCSCVALFDWLGAQKAILSCKPIYTGGMTVAFPSSRQDCCYCKLHFILTYPQKDADCEVLPGPLAGLCEPLLSL